MLSPSSIFPYYGTTAKIVTRKLSSIRNKQRPRIVVIGSGWAGNTLARRLKKDLYDVRLISPANHFLFTPLLPSTAVGTLEFRAIQEPVRTIQGLGEYYQAKAMDLDTENQFVQFHWFEFPYDLTSKVGITLVAAYFSPFNIAKEAMYVFCELPLKAQILVLLENL